MTEDAAPGARTRPALLVGGGLLLVAFAFAYSYFFIEGLPWFWYDDVDRMARAERSGWARLAADSFDLASPNYATERPVLQLFVKASVALFGEDAHMHRVAKLVLFCATLGGIYLLQLRNGVRWWLAAGGLALAATWPSVMIVTSWAYEAATIELFFKVCAFALFLRMLRDDASGASTARLAAKGALLLVLVILADHAKGTGKIIPAVFLATLALLRPLRVRMLCVALLALAAAFPWAVVLGAGMPGLSSASRLPTMFLNFVQQAGWFAPAVVLAAVLSRVRALPDGSHLRFLLCWLGCELAFYRAYPSHELRYNFASLVAAGALGPALVSFYLDRIEGRTARRALAAACCLLALGSLSFNTWWNDSFRGGWGGFLVMIDKKIQYVNARYRNSIFLYVNYNLPFYEWRTTNRFANVNPVNSWGMKFDTFFVVNNFVCVVDPEKYEHILVDDSVNPKYMNPAGIFYGVIEGSMYDRVRKLFPPTIYRARMYDLKMNSTDSYPLASGISQADTQQIEIGQLATE